VRLGAKECVRNVKECCGCGVYERPPPPAYPGRRGSRRASVPDVEDDE